MQADNPFDKKLDIFGNRVPSDVRKAATFVTDTLDLCWASAKAVFEERATPDTALAIYDRVLQRIQKGDGALANTQEQDTGDTG